MKYNESDTFPTTQPATADGRPNGGLAAEPSECPDELVYARNESSPLTTAFRLEPRTVDDDANASKFRSPGRLKAQRTKGAPPIGLRRKLAKGLLPAGPIQACEI